MSLNVPGYAGYVAGKKADDLKDAQARVWKTMGDFEKLAKSLLPENKWYEAKIINIEVLPEHGGGNNRDSKKESKRQRRKLRREKEAAAQNLQKISDGLRDLQIAITAKIKEAVMKGAFTRALQLIEDGRKIIGKVQQAVGTASQASDGALTDIAKYTLKCNRQYNCPEQRNAPVQETNIYKAIDEVGVNISAAAAAATNKTIVENIKEAINRPAGPLLVRGTGGILQTLNGDMKGVLLRLARAPAASRSSSSSRRRRQRQRRRAASERKKHLGKKKVAASEAPRCQFSKEDYKDGAEAIESVKQCVEAALTVAADLLDTSPQLASPTATMSNPCIDGDDRTKSIKKLCASIETFYEPLKKAKEAITEFAERASQLAQDAPRLDIDSDKERGKKKKQAALAGDALATISKWVVEFMDNYGNLQGAEDRLGPGRTDAHQTAEKLKKNKTKIALQLTNAIKRLNAAKKYGAFPGWWTEYKSATRPAPIKKASVPKAAPPATAAVGPATAAAAAVSVPKAAPPKAAPPATAEKKKKRQKKTDALAAEDEEKTRCKWGACTGPGKAIESVKQGVEAALTVAADLLDPGTAKYGKTAQKERENNATISNPCIGRKYKTLCASFKGMDKTLEKAEEAITEFAERASQLAQDAPRLDIYSDEERRKKKKQAALAGDALATISKWVVEFMKDYRNLQGAARAKKKKKKLRGTERGEYRKAERKKNKSQKKRKGGGCGSEVRVVGEEANMHGGVTADADDTVSKLIESQKEKKSRLTNAIKSLKKNTKYGAFPGWGEAYRSTVHGTTCPVDNKCRYTVQINNFGFQFKAIWSVEEKEKLCVLSSSSDSKGGGTQQGSADAAAAHETAAAAAAAGTRTAAGKCPARYIEAKNPKVGDTVQVKWDNTVGNFQVFQSAGKTTREVAIKIGTILKRAGRGGKEGVKQFGTLIGASLKFRYTQLLDSLRMLKNALQNPEARMPQLLKDVDVILSDRKYLGRGYTWPSGVVKLPFKLLSKIIKIGEAVTKKSQTRLGSAIGSAREMVQKGFEKAKEKTRAAAAATKKYGTEKKCNIQLMVGMESPECRAFRITNNFQKYILIMYFALSAVGERSVYTGISNIIPSTQPPPTYNTLLMMYPKVTNAKIKKTPKCQPVDGDGLQSCIGRMKLTYTDGAATHEGGSGTKAKIKEPNRESIEDVHFKTEREDEWVFKRGLSKMTIMASRKKPCYEYGYEEKGLNVDDLLKRIVVPIKANIVPNIPVPPLASKKGRLTQKNYATFDSFKNWSIKKSILFTDEDACKTAATDAKTRKDADAATVAADAALAKEENKKYPLGIRGNIKILKNEIALCKKQLKKIDDEFKIIINPKCLDLDNKDRDEKCIELWYFVNKTFQNLFDKKVCAGGPIAQTTATRAIHGDGGPLVGVGGAQIFGGASYLRGLAGKAKGAVASAAAAAASKVKSSLISYTPPIKPTYQVSMRDALDELGRTLGVPQECDHQKTIDFKESLKEYLKGKSPKMQQDILEKMRDIIKQPFKDKCKILNDILTIATTTSSTTIVRKRQYMLEQIPLLKEKAESATASAATATQGGGLNILTGGAQTATAPTVGDITQINANLKPDESWDAIEKGLINEKLTTIANSRTLEGRLKKLDDIRYSSGRLSKTFGFSKTTQDTAKDLLKRREDGWPAENYAQRLLKAIVETWVLQDYYKQLETDSNTLGISVPTSSADHAWSHGLDLRPRTGPSRSTRGPSLLSRMGSLFSRKHLNHLNKCPACGSGDCASGVEREVKECKENPSCNERMNDARRIIDIMIRPSPIAPYYDVVVYQNPVGQSAANMVSKTAAAATGLSRGKPPIPTAEQTAAATNIQALARGHAARQSAAQQRAQTSASQPNVVLFQGQGKTMSGNPVTTYSLPIATAIPIPEAQIVPTQFQPSAPPSA